MSHTLEGGRFCARDANRAMSRARRQMLEAKADGIVETLYPAIRRAARKGEGELRWVAPVDLPQDLRAAVITSLRIDGYIVRDEPEGTTVAWAVAHVSERSE